MLKVCKLWISKDKDPLYFFALKVRSFELQRNVRDVTTFSTPQTNSTTNANIMNLVNEQTAPLSHSGSILFTASKELACQPRMTVM